MLQEQHVPSLPALYYLLSVAGQKDLASNTTSFPFKEAINNMKWKHNFCLQHTLLLAPYAVHKILYSTGWNKDFLNNEEINSETLEFYSSFMPADPSPCACSFTKEANENLSTSWTRVVGQVLFATRYICKTRSWYSKLHPSETAKPFTSEIPKNCCYFSEEWCWSSVPLFPPAPVRETAPHVLHLTTRGA